MQCLCLQETVMFPVPPSFGYLLFLNIEHLFKKTHLERLHESGICVCQLPGTEGHARNFTQAKAEIE